MPKVDLILFPRFQMLAYVLATETLRVANKCAGRALFSWRTLSATNAALQASSGALVAPDSTDWADTPAADLTLLCAGYDPLAAVGPRVRAHLARAARGGGVLGGVDTGTVILAELGLLDGRRAVLHHEAEPAFRERWPDIAVTDQIYCLEGARLTAAGGTATGDAVLAWMARDVDPALAKATSDGMAHGRPRRQDTPQRDPTTRDPVLLHMHALMQANRAAPLPMTEICARLGLSPKQLRRRCLIGFGVTPSAYDRRLRLTAARDQLCQSAQPLTEVALACGFDSLTSFSRAFRHAFGQSPRAMRKGQRQGPVPSAGRDRVG